MSVGDGQLRRLLSARAAEWYVARPDSLSAERRAEFLCWLKSSPLHVAEYLAVAALAAGLAALAPPAGCIEALLERARREPGAVVQSLAHFWRRSPPH